MTEAAAVVVDPATAQPAVVPTPTPTPTPAPAAVVPPVVPVAPSEGLPEVVPVVYAATGDDRLDIALDYVGGLGIAQDHPAMQEAAKGNFEQLKGLLSGLGDKAKGHERFINLAQTAFNDAQAKVVEQGKLNDAAAFKAVGGEEQWKVISAWASANATPQEKADINAMLKAGTFQAAAAASKILEAYQKAVGTTVEPASAVKADANKGAPQAQGSLTNKEYAQAVNVLARRIGSANLNGHPEYLALQARRA